MTSHYDVLGVHPLASQEEIRKAYQAKCRTCHPDTRRSGYASSVDMNAITEAYRLLCNAELRRQYDLRLRSVPSAPVSALVPFQEQSYPETGQQGQYNPGQYQQSFGNQPSFQQQSPYDILGLLPTATLHDIVAAFQYYSAMNLSTEQRSLLNQAFSTLIESRYEHPLVQSPPPQQLAPSFSVNMSFNFGPSGFNIRT